MNRKAECKPYAGECKPYSGECKACGKRAHFEKVGRNGRNKGTRNTTLETLLGESGNEPTRPLQLQGRTTLPRP